MNEQIPERHRAFAAIVEASKLQDPRPTFENLSEETRIPVEDLMHHALTRWAAAGAEALMAAEPQALRELKAAVDREDWAAVKGMVGWLMSGR